MLDVTQLFTLAVRLGANNCGKRVYRSEPLSPFGQERHTVARVVGLRNDW